MKALSILQPWAWLIAAGHKDIENRSWSTGFRGRFAIHAGKKLIRDEYMVARLHHNDLPAISSLTRGAIIGVAEIVDCVSASESKWFAGPCGFVVRGARLLRAPVACKGSLGLFNLPEEIDEQILRQL